ncbi:hypothetical protein FNL55_03445 [Tardiphaga sp. vice352]|uniref:hypothetical protein n=1 Tax=unclassified Tardiphaga TaxID=2631404 RepID=UPI001165AADD|nr:MULTISPECIES: hypothetical protein [unclassified Tardiphaga]QDM15107.1 hypothetical protein FNL53_03395 [Tardiphaga sp. vice278]QDM20219.1 hypothetical protein FIU28_02885 [Tardiphaga sp. vice154]QDM25297.1 hypothetical protein FNL56_03370 [Tardiphaga sp. vice304]QDM30504.1 hypothetical protein FNL55_03445 [Tardiphaga sp. vice352]
MKASSPGGERPKRRINLAGRACPVRTSGVASVKPARRQGAHFARFEARITVVAQPRRLHSIIDHYCIATDQELWFEKLDFDAF